MKRINFKSNFLLSVGMMALSSSVFAGALCGPGKKKVSLGSVTTPQGVGSNYGVIECKKKYPETEVTSVAYERNKDIFGCYKCVDEAAKANKKKK